MPPLDRQLRLLRCYAVLTYPFACVPFLFLYFRAHGLDVQGYGLVIAAYYLAMFVAEVPTGMLADRFGPRALLIAGPLLLAAGFGTLAQWPTESGFLLGEVLLGLGHATLSGPPATILWQTLHERGQAWRYLREEGRIHGLRLCGTGGSFLLGGLLAEGLADAEGFAWRTTITLTCALNVVAALIAALLPRGSGRPMPSLPEFARAVRTDLALPAVRWLLAYWIVLFALLRYPFHNYQPYLDEAATREPAFARPLVIGTVYALLNAIAAPLSWAVPRLVAGVGRRVLFWAMPLLLCGSLLVMAWERQHDGGAGSRALAWLGVSMFVLQQVPFGMHWALLQEFVNHRIAATARTTVMSVLSLGARLCYAGVNAGLFALQQSHGMAVALLVAGGGGALATVAVLWIRPRGLLRGDGPLA